jgi:hypothetical protein
MPVETPRELAVLWRLGDQKRSMRCAVVESANGLQLMVDGDEVLLLTGFFQDGTRLLSRADQLRAAFTERGWIDLDR